MRYCGIDISASAANQQLCTLHERRGERGRWRSSSWRRSTCPARSRRSRATVLGFGGEAVAAVDAPSGHRLDLLAPGAPLREELGVPEGRFERHRVCDALLFRRRLPLYPVPSASQALAAWERWIGVGFEMFAALAPLGLFRPDDDERRPGPRRERRAALRAPLRDVPRRGLLLDDRPPPAAQAHAVGPAAADRGAARARRHRRGRRPVAPHARRARRVRGGLRRVHAGQRRRHVDRRRRARASSCCPSRTCCRATTRCRRRRGSPLA